MCFQVDNKINFDVSGSIMYYMISVVEILRICLFIMWHEKVSGCYSYTDPNPNPKGGTQPHGGRVAITEISHTAG